MTAGGSRYVKVRFLAETRYLMKHKRRLISSFIQDTFDFLLRYYDAPPPVNTIIYKNK